MTTLGNSTMSRRPSALPYSGMIPLTPPRELPDSPFLKGTDGPPPLLLAPCARSLCFTPTPLPFSLPFIPEAAGPIQDINSGLLTLYPFSSLDDDSCYSCKLPTPLSPLPEPSWWDGVWSDGGSLQQEEDFECYENKKDRLTVDLPASVALPTVDLPDIPAVCIVEPPATIPLESPISTVQPSPSFPSSPLSASPVYGPYLKKGLTQDQVFKSGGKLGPTASSSSSSSVPPSASPVPPPPLVLLPRPANITKSAAHAVAVAIRTNALYIDLCSDDEEEKGNQSEDEDPHIDHEEVYLSDSPLSDCE